MPPGTKRMVKGKKGEVWIYGIHSVASVLEARPGRVRKMMVAEGGSGARARLIKKAESLGMEVERTRPREMDRIVGADSHQGIAVMAPLPEYADLEQVAERSPHLIVALDSITDAHNFGAIARSAEALGASGLIIAKDRSAGMSAAAHKASAGALEWLPVCMVVNLSRTLRELKEHGYWIYAALPEGEEITYHLEFKEKTAIIIGSEGGGIRPGVIKDVDFRVKIPLFGRTESLNASVSSAIILHDIIRARASDSDPGD